MMLHSHRTRLALVVAAGMLSGCTDSTPPDAQPSAPVTSLPTPSPTASASSTETAAWYVVDTRAGLRLARERLNLTDGSVTAAVTAMIAGPQDPDYSTPWNPETRVLGVQEQPGLITVDLSAEARVANVGSPGAALMIQQLVWTATEAAGSPTAGVRLLIEGEPAGELWGAVTWDGPIMRAAPLEIRMLVQLDTPTHGEVVPARNVVISGEAAVAEANLLWNLYRGNGTLVESGFTSTAAAQEFAPFSIPLALEPGDYVIEILEDSLGGPAMSDTRAFTAG